MSWAGYLAQQLHFRKKHGGVSLAEPCRWDSLLCRPGLPHCKALYHRCSYPVEVLEVELFEDGVSAFHLVPPHGSQVRQQPLPLLCAQPVGFSCLTPWEGKGRGADQRGRGRMKQMLKAARCPMGRGVHGGGCGLGGRVGVCADLNCRVLVIGEVSLLSSAPCPGICPVST